jgi:uncharacterized protein
MSEKENAELVRSFYSNFLAGDIDAVAALLSPDFTLVYAGPSIIPCAGTWNGHDGFRSWTEAALRGHLPPSSVNTEEFIVRGDNVAVPGHVSLRVKTTGKTCETDFLHLFTARSGKLTSWRDFFDTYAVAQAYMN